MSTSPAFIELSENDVIQALCEILVPSLKIAVRSRTNGHCMRVANLDRDLMIALCQTLRQSCPDEQIYILGNGNQKQSNGHRHDREAASLFISSTKLVELRNPLPGGELRPPLLVFLPAQLQVSAEDSFGVATFEDIPVIDVYARLQAHLLQQIPAPLQRYVQDLVAPQQQTQPWWPWADQVARVRFLLTAVKNQVDGEVLGASLYELGLVPDLRLFDDPVLMPNRIRRNLDAVQKITNSDASIRGRVLELGLKDRELQKNLITFLSEAGVANPHLWTRQIIMNKAYRMLTFDKWQFIDEIKSDRVALRVTKIDIPKVGEDSTDERLADLNGQMVLNPNKNPKFSIIFSVDPHPTRVPSLDHFTVQILTEDGEPIGGAKRVKVWTTRKAVKAVNLDKLNKLDLADGWHFVRVLPWTKDEEPVPLVGSEPNAGSPVKPNQSEPFYVLREGEVVEPPQRVTPTSYSFEHAKLQAQFKELAEQHDPQAVRATQVEWIEKAGKIRLPQQEILEVKFENGEKFHIHVSRHLKALECAALTEPQLAAHWTWHVDMRAPGSDGPVADERQLPKSVAVESFLDARARYFAAIGGSAPEKERILQAVDITGIVATSVEYAEAYRDLLLDLKRKVEQSRGADQQAMQDLRAALTLDTVHLTLVDIRGNVKEAALVGPFHPLRALWFGIWSMTGKQWLRAAQDGPEEYLIPARDGLLRAITPLNVPATLVNTDGRVFLMVDHINPFWSLYAPPATENTRALVGEVSTLLGLPEPAISGEMISAEALFNRIARYLAQHPYIRTLSINAFNPGRAEVLAQALVRLQKEEAFLRLRYDVRLFVPDPAMPRVGEAIEALFSPNAAMTTEANDAFATPGNSHLFPKLSLAIHALDDFKRAPQRFYAHLSMLFDLFPATEVGAGSAFNAIEMMPLYGLIQDFTTRFQDTEAGTFWQRQPQHGSAVLLPDAEEAIDLFTDLSALLSGMVATIATGSPAFEQRPVITVSLNTEQRELIHYIHEVSDWALTIDRNIGIEFFDHGEQDERPEYLIDYIPDSASGSGHRLITTSRALVELKATLQPVLSQRGLAAGNRETTIILHQLRSLSGRLALKLISSPTQQAEALGLALARLFLRQQGALSNQIILPLDTHQDLFHAAKRVREEIGESATLQRTDLALFDLNAATQTIRCNLVEVKCYADVGGVSAYAQLKEEITAQLEKSQEVLRYHFDPCYKQPDRPDRLLKTRELVTLLTFYLGRSLRYGLVRQDAYAEAHYFLAMLECGYTLQFTRSALIFDFERSGMELVDSEHGIEFYRIGKDAIAALLAEYSSLSVPQAVSAASSASSFPSAAFLAPARDHSISEGYAAQADQQEEQQEWVDAPALTAQPPDDELPDYGTWREQPTAEEPEQAAQEAILNSPPALETIHHTVEQGLHESDNTPAAKQSLSPDEDTIEHPPAYGVMLGVQRASPQYGIFGEVVGKKVALDLNQTHTISLFGVQGSGKSYTLGSIVEMACLPVPNVNVLPRPLATVIFHYSPTQDYKPEFTSMVHPNTDTDQIAQLHERYGAQPCALQDIVLLAPAAKVAERQREYPDIEVQPITFAASELKAVHWKFLMGAVGSQSAYLRQINLLMKKLRDNLTLDALLQEVTNAPMSEHLKDLAQMRLQFAAEYIDDSRKLTDVIRPGRLIIVDIRDEFIEKDEALGLFVVLLQIFSEATYQGKAFNKLVVFDEAHKYIENLDLVSGLIEVVREMRHKGTSIMVASQDPPSVPGALIELSTQIILHRCNSPAWLKHIQKANSSLSSLTPEKMSHLGAGEAYVWSAKASDDGFTRGAIKVKCRPRVTQHGGDTRTAVEQEQEL